MIFLFPSVKNERTHVLEEGTLGMSSLGWPIFA